jgi:hypothetical protein
MTPKPCAVFTYTDPHGREDKNFTIEMFPDDGIVSAYSFLSMFLHILRRAGIEDASHIEFKTKTGTTGLTS